MPTTCQHGTCEADAERDPAYEFPYCDKHKGLHPTREQIAEINEQSKQRRAERRAELGLKPGELMPTEEELKLGEWYRAQHLAFRGLDANFRPLKKDEQDAPARRRLSPEDRMKRETGLVCKHGHDLTGHMPNGKSVLYIAPNGDQACRWCKKDAADRHKAKTTGKGQTSK